MREKGLPKFSFHFVTLEETLKEAALLSDKKTSQASDIPVKIIKENRDLIAYFLLHNVNNALSCSEYPASLKYADINQSLKRMTIILHIVPLLKFCLVYLKDQFLGH